MKMILSNEELRAIRDSIIDNKSSDGLELYNKIVKNEEESITVSRINDSEVCITFDVDTAEVITTFGPLAFELIADIKSHGFTPVIIPKVISFINRCKALI